MVLLAVNEEGHESGQTTMSALGDVPILQDTVKDNVWTSWEVTYRDVVILDEDNVEVDVYNLTSKDLNDPANDQDLSDLITAELGP